MKEISNLQAKIKKLFLFGLVFAQAFSIAVYAQKSAPKASAKNRQNQAKKFSNLPKVKRIDTLALRNLLKRDGENAKPLLVNFWATWCDPCREEFPELVRINRDYQGKIDFITVSLDDAAIINSDVPKFLSNMKADMPAYLLNTDDEEAAISSVSKDWQGGLPFTILLNQKGDVVYARQGKINVQFVRNEIDTTLKTEITK